MKIGGGTPRSWRTAIATLACSAAVIAGCGGGPLPVKSMVAEGKWVDACYAVYPHELATQDTDMSMLEFDDAVISRAQAKIDVKVAPRLIVEQMLGGDPRLRRSPRRAQRLPEKETSISLLSQIFMADHVLLLWHVESAEPVHARISMPKLTRGGMGGAWGSPLEDASAVSRQMGFLRTPESCDNSLSAVGSRLLGKLTTTPGLDLTCSSAEGRTPTPEEQAFAGTIAPALLWKPCAPEAASCTQIALIRPWDPIDHRVDQMEISVSFSLAPDCYVGKSLNFPLGPATVERLEPSVRRLFPSGPRPFAELSAFKDAPAPEAAAKGAPAPGCKDTACTENGRCTEVGGQCFIGGDADCKASELCKVEGWCSALLGTTAVGPAFVDTLCASASDADCAGSEACRLAGQCAAEGGLCVAKTSAHCAASEACTRFGLCSLAGRSCRAVTDADCQRSELCTGWKSCHAEAGNCR